MILNEPYIDSYISTVILVVAVIIYLLVNGKDESKTELFYDNSSVLLGEILNKCLCLKSGYIPTVFWGKYGHIQSMMFAVLGRFGAKSKPTSKRHELIAKDGSLVSYDVFTAEEKIGTLLVVPGICNHAENTYIQVFSQHMTSLGYDVVVFNHTGALKSVKLSQGKIFTYGHTEDLAFVVSTFLENSKISSFSAAIGFSLGANIVMKYLGEKTERQKYFQCAVSVCQGYNVMESSKYFKQWENFRCLYNHLLTRKMLKVILHHKDTLEEHLDVNWKRVRSVKMLHQLDQEFTMKMIKDEPTIDEFYCKSSSSRYMENIKIPLLIMNAKDDPMVPETLYKYPKKLVETNSNVLFVVTSHGGHLGYFEGGVIVPNKLSWMDRLIGQFVQASNEQKVDL